MIYHQRQPHATCPYDGTQTPATIIIYSAAYVSRMRAGEAVTQEQYVATVTRAMSRRPLSVVNGRPC